MSITYKSNHALFIWNLTLTSFPPTFAICTGAVMESEDSADTVRQCPLCQMPMGSKNELQLHYLTSCSGYDRGTAVTIPNLRLSG